MDEISDENNSSMYPIRLLRKGIKENLNLKRFVEIKEGFN